MHKTLIFDLAIGRLNECCSSKWFGANPVELIVLHLTGFPADIDQPSDDYENDLEMPPGVETIKPFTAIS